MPKRAKPLMCDRCAEVRVLFHFIIKPPPGTAYEYELGIDGDYELGSLQDDRPMPFNLCAVCLHGLFHRLETLD